MGSPRRLRGCTRLAWSLVWWAGVALVVCLDRRAGIRAQHAAVVGWIIIALEAVWQGISVVGGAIATTLEGVVVWLVSAVGYITRILASLGQWTGAVFARVWDVFGTIWNRVVRPALLWLDEHILRLRDWLKQTFGPVFDWLKRIREFVTDIYDRFVRPVFDLIDFIRQLDHLLQIFHIDVLRGVDAWLTGLEQKIDEAFHWIYSRIAAIVGWVDFIVTADGFFQRYVLLRSQWKHVRDSWRLLAIHLQRPFTNDDQQNIIDNLRAKETAVIAHDVTEYLETGGGAEAPLIDEMYQQFLLNLR